MNSPVALWLGLGGALPEDNARAHEWQRRLQWIMIAIALLSLPAYVLDTAVRAPPWHRVASLLDGLIMAAFLAEAAWMIRVSSFPARYLAANWLNLFIIAAAFASLLGAATEWFALARVVRVALAGLVAARALAGLRVLLTPGGAPLLVGLACTTLALTAGLFYWLEPAVNSYWDGLWLAFVTGTTVGYGDFVPSTPAGRLVAVFVVLTGVSLLAVFTASIVAHFVGADEQRLRQDLRRDIRRLEEELAQLIGSEELELRRELHKEIRTLRHEVAELRNELAHVRFPG
jgi:voltage-gated potassium channel